MPTPVRRVTLWTIFLTLTLTYTFVFVAKVVSAERSTRTPFDPFPSFECAIHPFGFAADWGKMESIEKLSRSYCRIHPTEFVSPPPYDIDALQTPLEELNANTQSIDTQKLITMKLFYSTRPFGTYDLDSDEYVSPDHPGMDIKMPIGTPVRAIAGGTVNNIEIKKDGLGNTVVIEHHLSDTNEKVFSVYGHLNHILVNRGESVSPGTLIGTIGTSGNTFNPHLHLQIDRDRGVLRHIPYIPPPGATLQEATRWTIHPMEFIENY